MEQPGGFDWQSEEAILEIEPRIEAFSQLARNYEMPLLNALEAEYPDRARTWRLCGPSSIVLANLLSEDTGIPIIEDCHDRTIERLELSIMIYNPTERTNLHDKDDHTQLRYHSGKGVSLTVDPVMQLLWHNRPKAPGAFLIEWHLDHLMNRDMYEIFNLLAFRNAIAAGHSVDLWETGLKFKSHLQSYMEFRSLMHSPRIFDDRVRTLSGKTVDVSAFWGTRLKNVYGDVRRAVPKQEWAFAA